MSMLVNLFQIQIFYFGMMRHRGVMAQYIHRQFILVILTVVFGLVFLLCISDNDRESRLRMLRGQAETN